MDALDHALGGIGGFPVFAPTRQRLTQNHKYDSHTDKDKQETQYVTHLG
jgi:hypothetical protein